jgi:hypothetical protein
MKKNINLKLRFQVIRNSAARFVSFLGQSLKSILTTLFALIIIWGIFSGISSLNKMAERKEALRQKGFLETKLIVSAFAKSNNGNTEIVDKNFGWILTVSDSLASSLKQGDGYNILVDLKLKDKLQIFSTIRDSSIGKIIKLEKEKQY